MELDLDEVMSLPLLSHSIMSPPPSSPTTITAPPSPTEAATPPTAPALLVAAVLLPLLVFLSFCVLSQYALLLGYLFWVSFDPYSGLG